MIYILEVLEGQYKGRRFKIKPGSKLGRSQGDIIIPDSKISSEHVVFEISESGVVRMVDLKSSNGIVVRGKVVRSLILTHGVIFRLGRVRFQFHIESGRRLGPISKDQDEGEKNLFTMLEKLKINSQPSPDLFSPLNPLITLNFLEGPHADRILVLGYGPREIGRSSLDINLEDSKAPPIACGIKPDSNYGAFVECLSENEETEQILLNSKTFKMEKITDGDILQIGRSIIKLSYGATSGSV